MSIVNYYIGKYLTFSEFTKKPAIKLGKTHLAKPLSLWYPIGTKGKAIEKLILKWQDFS